MVEAAPTSPAQTEAAELSDGGGTALVWGAFAVLAVLLGRGVAPALPGSLAGCDRLIQQTLIGGAVLTQFAAMLFTLFGIRALIGLFTHKRQVGLKLVMLFITGFTTISVALTASGVYGLPASWFGALSGCVGFGAMTAASAVGGVPRLRAPGLVLLCCALAGVIHTAGRLLASASSLDASAMGYMAARGVATGAWFLEVLALLVSAAWLASVQSTPFRVSGLAALAAGAGVAANSRADVGWLVVTRRALEALSPHPDPLLPRALLDFAALSGLAICALALFASRRPAPHRLVVVLALIARASLDVPLGALLFSCATLALLQELPQSSGRPVAIPMRLRLGVKN